MFDLHTHSLLSDGVLLPSEMAVRYAVKGYKLIAITDHCDYSNIKRVTSEILEFVNHWPKDSDIKILPGVELTHLPLYQFKPLSEYARRQGIKIIVGHGQTLAEPVIEGTNRAALESDIDILAHPGMISQEDVLLAKEKEVLLEITARKGHRQTNSHVANLAKKIGAKLVLNTDSHLPEDILTNQELKNVALMSGLGISDYERMLCDCNGYIKAKLKE